MQDPHNDWGKFAPFAQADVQPFIEELDRQSALLAHLASDEPVAYDGFGAPLYAHQVPAEGTE